jgi:hypothetical protein
MSYAATRPTGVFAANIHALGHAAKSLSQSATEHDRVSVFGPIPTVVVQSLLMMDAIALARAK